jgi:hypothetical protein
MLAGRYRIGINTQDARARGPDLVDAEGDVRVGIAVEEVSRTQVRIALLYLGVDRCGGHSDGTACFAARRDGTFPDR